jgi:hypothetical protein
MAAILRALRALRAFRPAPVLLGLVLAAGAVALAPAGARAQACPDGFAQFNGGTSFGAPAFVVTGAVFDTVLSPTKQLGYDLPSGQLTLRADGKFPTSIRARDRFDVTGVPAGTPVALVVELAAQGTIATIGCGGSNCWGYLGVRIVHGAAQASDVAQENIFSGPPRPVEAVAQLPVVIVAGQPETIELELYAIGAAEFRETGLATFRFLGLPPGASIVSCHGYVDAPTPARAVSWGRVKAVYR